MAAVEAVKEIKDGMVVGLGTGSTAKYAILEIGKMVEEGFEITGIATSVESERIAREAGIKIGDINDYDAVDLTIDGADEVDKNLNLIKGGGGALLREKIVAKCSRREIIVVDERKVVNEFSLPLPVEIVKFGWKKTCEKLSKLGFNVNLRHGFVTDNGNYIVDCEYASLKNLKEMEKEINNIPGVVENGLFIEIADEVIAGTSEGIKKFKRK